MTQPAAFHDFDPVDLAHADAWHWAARLTVAGKRAEAFAVAGPAIQADPYGPAALFLGFFGTAIRRWAEARGQDPLAVFDFEFPGRLRRGERG